VLVAPKVSIIGTIAALLYRCFASIRYSNKVVLGRSQFSTYKIWLVNGSVFLLVMAILFVDRFSGMSFFKLLLCGVVHSVWIVALYAVANYLFNREAFNTIFELYKEKTKR